MLSIIILTAITVVALPNLRITTLTIIRTILMANVIGVVLYLQGSFDSPDVDTFGGIIIFDLIGDYFSILLFGVGVLVLAYTNIPSLTVNKIPITGIILIVIISIGASFLIISNDIVNFAISLELQSFSLYAITCLSRDRPGTTQAALMYFILGAFSSGLIFLGIGIIFAYTGESNFDTLIPLIYLNSSEPIIIVSGVLITSGLLFKISAAPFHWWGPEVYSKVPTVTSLFLIVIPKFSLVVFIIRINSLIGSTGINTIINTVIILSWSIGGIIGLVQTRLKSLLAYSTISHVGWILAGIFSSSILGIGSALFYIAQYSATTALTFLCIIAIGFAVIGGNKDNIKSINESSQVSESYDIDIIYSLNGFSSRSVIFTTIIATTLFSAAGIPPIVGFFAKLSIIQSILWGDAWLTAITGIIFSVVSAGYYLNLISTIMFKNRTLIK